MDRVHKTRRRGHDRPCVRHCPPEPVLHGGARSVPAVLAQVRPARDRALLQRLGRSRRVPARALQEGRRRRLHGPRLPGGLRRDRGRPLHAHHRHAGDRARGLRRRGGGALFPHDRRAADFPSRIGRDEGARAAADPVGRENLGARHHRAFRRLRRRQPAHDREARRRSFRDQRLEDLHHLGHARRLHHARRAHRRPRRRAA